MIPKKLTSHITIQRKLVNHTEPHHHHHHSNGHLIQRYTSESQWDFRGNWHGMAWWHRHGDNGDSEGTAGSHRISDETYL